MSALKKKSNTIQQVPKVMLKKISNKLKQRRKELGYTSSDTFAYDVGINRSQYGKYEKLKKDIRIGTLIKVVNLMGLTIEEFFGSGFED